mmetsp:Transcript_14067/g.28692  ORF Transcript_14067/g.28692 Transcript_14067/m.28692 type:complete len:382 (-) Transcript_14067:156-1301(-)
MNRAAIDSMLTNSLGSTFSATFQFRGSLEGGIDGLDFSDNLDMLDEHMLDDMFPEGGSVSNHDDSFRDSFMATFTIPGDHQPSAVVSSEAAGDANMETDHFQMELMGPTMTGGGAPYQPYQRPRRRQTVDSAPEFKPEQLQRPPRRRVTTNSFPEFMPELLERRAHGHHNATSGFDEVGHQGDHHMSSHHLQRPKSESMLLQPHHLEDPSRRKIQFHSPNYGNEPLAADIHLAVHEAEDKMIRLQELLEHNQGPLHDHVGGNNHPHAQHQMSPQPAPSNNWPMRRISEHGLPWTPSCPPHHLQQMQQEGNMQQLTMAKLQAAMERTSSTMKLLQDWDRAHGLPASHCQTMVNTSRSRKQLKEGVVLKKWNGSPLLNAGRMT